MHIYIGEKEIYFADKVRAGNTTPFRAAPAVLIFPEIHLSLTLRLTLNASQIFIWEG